MGTMIQTYLAGLLRRLNILLIKYFVQRLLFRGPSQIVPIHSPSPSLGINICWQKKWPMNACTGRELPAWLQGRSHFFHCCSQSWLPTMENVKVDIPEFEGEKGCASGSRTANPLNHLGNFLNVQILGLQVRPSKSASLRVGRTGEESCI